MTFRITRRYRFSASHRLHCAALSEAENAELYGKCNNPYGHGHNYQLEVSVRGAMDPSSGLVLDVPRLDVLVKREVLARFEHRNLNEEVPAFHDTVPTTENLAAEIERRLAGGWTGAFPGGPALAGVCVRETKNNTVELTR